MEHVLSFAIFGNANVFHVKYTFKSSQVWFQISETLCSERTTLNTFVSMICARLLKRCA